MPSVNFDVVRFADGSVDLDSTMDQIRLSVAGIIEQMESESEGIGKAVNGIFDQYKGQTIAMPAIQALVLQRLNASPETFKSLSEKVTDYLRNNSGEFGLFTIARGRAGGVSRNVDKR